MTRLQKPRITIAGNAQFNATLKWDPVNIFKNSSINTSTKRNYIKKIYIIIKLKKILINRRNSPFDGHGDLANRQSVWGIDEHSLILGFCSQKQVLLVNEPLLTLLIGINRRHCALISLSLWWLWQSGQDIRWCDAVRPGFAPLLLPCTETDSYICRNH